MLATPISSVPSANVPSPLQAAALPSGLQPTSIFDLIFREVLQGPAVGPKLLPPPGRQQDSSRVPLSKTGAASVPGTLPQGPAPFSVGAVPVIPVPSQMDPPTGNAVALEISAPLPRISEPLAHGALFSMTDIGQADSSAQSRVASGPLEFGRPAAMPGAPRVQASAALTVAPSEASAAALAGSAGQDASSTPQYDNVTPALAGDPHSTTATILSLEAPAVRPNSGAASPAVSAKESSPATNAPAAPAAPTAVSLPTLRVFSDPLEPITTTSQGEASLSQPSPSTIENLAATNATAEILLSISRVGRDLRREETPAPLGPGSQGPVTGAPHTTAKFETESAAELGAVAPSLPAPIAAPPANGLGAATTRVVSADATSTKFHPAFEPVAPTPSPSATTVPVTAKAPTQDRSNSGAGNNSNSKSDHPASASTEKADEKNFLQAVDTSGSTPAIGHSTPGPDANPASPAASPQAATAAPPADPDLRAASASGAEPSSPPPPLANPHGTPVVNAAHIVDQVGQTEIRIEMQADSLGGVELRARITGDQIGASIAVEHHEAQLALTTELPALHNALAEKNLRVETLSVTQGAFTSLHGGHEQGAGQRGQPQVPVKPSYFAPFDARQTFTETPAELASVTYSAGSLSVLA